jgi:hypothetical protein
MSDRKHFAYIVDGGDHPTLREGLVEVRDEEFVSLTAGEQSEMRLAVHGDGEFTRFTVEAIGLGYHDFEDGEYGENERTKQVIEEKMEQYAPEHCSDGGDD